MAVKVVQYNGKADELFWKYPESELNAWTQLIVNDSQEAILVKGGQVCDIFQAGRHSLRTKNIPILNKLIKIPFGGISPYKAEVWYVNKLCLLDVKWGTPTPIQIQDPKYNIFVPVSAFGQFGIQIENSKKFLMKLVGTMPSFDKTAIIDLFKGVCLTKVKDIISQFLVNKKVSVLEINAYIDLISKTIQNEMDVEFSNYGIKLVSFFVNGISIPENDESVKQLKSALAKQAEMDLLGYNYQQERSFDVMEGATTNPNSFSSEFMGAGMGFGMGVGIGNMFANQFNGMTKNFNTSNTKSCVNCGQQLSANNKFCPFCGQQLLKTCICGKVVDFSVKFCPDCGKPI